MSGWLHRGQGPVASILPLLLLMILTCISCAPVVAAAPGTTRPPINPLGSAGSSSTGIIVGCVVSIVGVLLLAGLVALVCLVRRRRRLGYSRGHVYADADSIAFQDDHHDSPGQSRARRVAQQDGMETAGMHSHHTMDSNEPMTPPLQNPTTPQMRDRRDNYADRFESRTNQDDDGYDADGGVRPASPNADRVEGVAIENRVRPHRNLPRGRVVIHHNNQDVCLDFRGVERVPQAGPPPLTLEEKQRIIDEQNRVASPEFYGRAEYEHRRASNTNTPNVLLSSSLLREMQQQYAAASASGHAFPSYASDAGRSIGSMSFRPGSPAGSVRRGGWRDSRQSTTPTSTTLGNGQLMRHRKKGSRHHTGSRDTTGDRPPHHAHSSAPRHYRDDLESTSDDFEDLSLHETSGRLAAMASSAAAAVSSFPSLGASLGFDQMSLRSNSPGAFDRYMSAAGSVNGAAGFNASVTSGFGVPSPLDYPQDPPAARTDTPHGPQSTQSASATSLLMWAVPLEAGAAAWRSPPHQAIPKAPDGSGGKGGPNKKNAGESRPTTNTASTSNTSAQSPGSLTTSPGVQPAPPELSPMRSPSSPSNPLINFLAVSSGPSTHVADRNAEANPIGVQRHRGLVATTASTTPVFSAHSGATFSGTGQQHQQQQTLDISLGVRSDATTSSRGEGVLLPAPASAAGGGGVGVAPPMFVAAVGDPGNTQSSTVPLSRVPRQEGSSAGVGQGRSKHSKSD